MKTIFRLIGKGLLGMLPIIILIWILSFLYGLILKFVQIIFNTTANSTIATIGVIVLMILLLLYTGYMLERSKNFTILKISEFLIAKIPVVSTIYSILKDMVKMFSGGGEGDYLGVAYVKIGNAKVIGLITKEEKGEDVFWVFVPTTPNPTSGLLLRLSKDDIEIANMSVADGLKKVVSLGIK